MFALLPLVSPAVASASSLTSAQVSAIISLLQSFGADQSVINNVQTSLTGGASSSSSSWCHTFNTNVGVGSLGDEVTALTIALQKENLGSYAPNDSFNEMTASWVSSFQEKYKSEILTPVGLSAGTGYLGARTRAKLNALYGCGNTNTIIPVPPVSSYPPVNSSQISITTSSPLPNAKVGTQYKAYLYASGGFSSYNWSTVVSSLPSGLIFTASDDCGITNSGRSNVSNCILIYGAPTQSGTFSFTLQAKDNSGGLGIATKQFTITVDPATTNNQSITIVYPSGGETWNMNSSQHISWTSQGIDPNRQVGVYIHFPDGGLCYEGLTTVGAGSLNFSLSPQCSNIPKTLTQGQYTAFVTVGDITGTDFVAKDDSAPFTINAAPTQTNSTLYLNLDVSTPPSQNITAGSVDVPVAIFHLRASGNDATINSFSVYTNSPNCNFTNLKLLDSSGFQIGSVVANATSDVGVSCHADFNNISYSIPKDYDKYVLLKLSIPASATAGSFSFGMGGMTVGPNITLPTNGPVFGQTMTIVALTPSPTLNISLNPSSPTGQTIYAGGAGYTFLIADLTAGSASDATIANMAFGISGTAGPYVTNLRLLDGNGALIGGQNPSNSQTFSPNLVIAKGSTQKVRLVGDISANATAGSQLLFALSNYNVTLSGQTAGAGVTGTAWPSVYTHTVAPTQTVSNPLCAAEGAQTASDGSCVCPAGQSFAGNSSSGWHCQ